jgi:hypothetical protein
MEDVVELSSRTLMLMGPGTDGDVQHQTFR